MAEFECFGLKAGVWSGRLTADSQPTRVMLVHRGQVVGQPRLTADGANAWRVDAAIPAERLEDGVTSLFLVVDDGAASPAADPAPGALRLGALTLSTGRALDGDLASEIALMRAEIDLRKQELRRLARGGDGAQATG